MGRRNSGSVSMQVEAEIDVAEFISTIGVGEEGHFIRTLLCEGDERVNRIRAEIVKALTPEIERRVKKELMRKLVEFVFGSDTTVEVVS